MNREIKFRAWDAIHNTMSDTFTLIDCIKDNQVFMLPENFKFMQYAGIRDKNDKDIYEGDIVHAIAQSPHTETSSTSDIIFGQDTAFTVRSRDKYKVYDHGLSLAWGGWESFEVIGNIYESPELLA